MRGVSTRGGRPYRPAAPHLFAEEFAGAIAVLEAASEVGRTYRHAAVPGLRRFLLRATRYHVYYVVTGDAAEILAIWSAVRGGRPPLRTR
jgi:plasmid stabilization system protein ParE